MGHPCSHRGGVQTVFCETGVNQLSCMLIRALALYIDSCNLYKFVCRVHNVVVIFT